MQRAVFLLLLCGLFAAPSLGAQSVPSAPAEALALQPGDAIRLEIWREPELSGEFRVDDAGRVVLPALGERIVAGRPFSEVRDELIEQLRVRLKNPSINITPLRRIYVLGEVQRPGLYAVDPTISLAGAVALAGGATPLGTLNHLRVVRAGQETPSRYSAQSTLTDVDIRSGDQVFVDRRSWFDRNSTFVVSAVLSLTSIVTSIIIATR